MTVFLLIVGATGAGFGLLTGLGRAWRAAAKKYPGQTPPTAAWVAPVAGGLLLVIALGSALYAWHFTRTARRTYGTVIEMAAHTDDEDHGPTYAPVFLFLDAGEITHVVHSKIYSSPPAFHVGEAVEILYLPDHPESARINSFSQIWGIPGFVWLMGMVTLLFGFIVIFLWRRTVQKQSPAASASAG